MTTSSEPTIVITGGAGFIGSNLAASFAQDGYRVIIVDNFSRPGVSQNWQWLEAHYGSSVQLEQDDIRNEPLAHRLAGLASAIFHFAAQVAVTDSLQDPIHDFETNLHGTLVWLEATRRAGRSIPFIFASTNKFYGPLSDVLLEKEEVGWVPCDRKLREHGVDEKRPLDFQTPYGCSKGGADQYVLDYARQFGIAATVLRMSCIYGPRQWGTADQGWLAHFARAMLTGQVITLYGDGRQMRDILYIDDAILTYRAAFSQISKCSGQAFNVGGGAENAISLLTALERLEGLIGASARIEFAPWRAGDQRWYVSNRTAIQNVLSLTHPLAWADGLARLADWIRAEHGHHHEDMRTCA